MSRADARETLLAEERELRGQRLVVLVPALDEAVPLGIAVPRRLLVRIDLAPVLVLPPAGRGEVVLHERAVVARFGPLSVVFVFRHVSSSMFTPSRLWAFTNARSPSTIFSWWSARYFELPSGVVPHVRTVTVTPCPWASSTSVRIRSGVAPKPGSTDPSGFRIT